MIFNPSSKLLWQGDRIKEWLGTGRTEPILVEIAPVGYCNASCPWCLFKNKRGTAQIDSFIMLEIIEDLDQLGVKAINWTGGGEPTLHPYFEEIVEKAAHLGLKQGLFTNGYREIPCQDKFKWIRISLTPEGMDRIVRPRVPFGIVLNQTADLTEAELRDLVLRVRDFGAKYFQIRPALVGDFIAQLKLNIPDYLKEYTTKDFEVYVTKYKYREANWPREYGFCYGYHFCPSIDWHGQLRVCLYMEGKEFILGDLNKTSILEIWPKITKKIKVVPGCQNCCKNHEINKVLDGARQAEMVEFL